MTGDRHGLSQYLWCHQILRPAENPAKKLHQKLCKMIVDVTHDRIEAMMLLTPIAVMNKRLVQQHCRPKQG
jgi:ABC-type proline/glycine betaine transport system ATPase subunit